MEFPEYLDGREVRQTVRSLENETLVLLEDLVNINSHFNNLDGVIEVLGLVAAALPVAMVPDQDSTTEDQIWIFKNAPHSFSPILLVGHLDTIHPRTVEGHALKDNGPYLCGPGTADMKGGLAVMCGALKVLDRMGLIGEIPLCCAFNGDQENGSVKSGPVLKKLAQTSRLGLVFEKGGNKGALVTSCRGLRSYRLEIKGQAGHAGLCEPEKQSTLLELAHQIIRLEGLSKPKRGLNLNVGLASGGTASSVIPDRASAEFDIRFWDEKSGDLAAERVMASLASPLTCGLDLNLSRRHSRPVMVRTEAAGRLFEQAGRIAGHLGLELTEEARPISSDANLLSAAGLAVLDGLGPLGEGEHSTEERIVKDTLFERMELVVHLLWGLRSHAL